MTGQIDTIVRFHDLRRLPELDRCLFSLVGQTYRPIRAIIAVQRFADDQIASLRAAIAPLFEGEDGASFDIVNYTEPEPRDARSALMDLGIRSVKGRYFAFLDYDDTLYPEAYELLINRLVQSSAGIAFASVRLMALDVYPSYIHTREKMARSFPGSTLLDLFQRNFAPLHSYAVDRERVPDAALIAETSRTLEEDYDFLLRVCAATPSDFKLLGIEIGDYNFKSDGSNTVASEGQPRPQLNYDEIKLAMELRRR
ncbi:MAG: glycosyltransferase family 2 protein, partial [Alphaproteobacteria bacterium]|nr:glycosyltransferase family 2 protein [Alphaproteobacteria bacterium]